MIDGIITPALRDIDYLAPSAPYPATPSGITCAPKDDISLFCTNR